MTILNNEDISLVEREFYSESSNWYTNNDMKSMIDTLVWLSYSEQEKKDILNEDIEDYFLEIPASIGSMVAFKVDQNCRQGYTPFEGKSLSIQLNYIYQGFLSKHNMRHDLSALFKKIPNILKK